MDTLTHALSGAVVARAFDRWPARLSPNARTIICALAAAFPDSDIVFRLSDPLMYLNLHRGPTHSFVLLPLWSVLLAFALTRIPRLRHAFRECLVLCAAGIATHILGDIITSFGTRIFYPVSTQRYSLDTTFIIDLIFSGILLLALLLSYTRLRYHAARTGLGILFAYIGFQAVLHQQAMEIARTQAATQHWETGAIAALPQPLSPFHWKLIVTAGERYHVAFINLWPSGSPHAAENSSWLQQLAAGYEPVATAQWRQFDRYGSPSDAALVEEIWSHRNFEAVRHFVVYPLFIKHLREHSRFCGWFIDLRFELPGLTTPFKFGLCQNGQRIAREQYH